MKTRLIQRNTLAPGYFVRCANNTETFLDCAAELRDLKPAFVRREAKGQLRFVEETIDAAFRAPSHDDLPAVITRLVELRDEIRELLP